MRVSLVVRPMLFLLGMASCATTARSPAVASQPAAERHFRMRMYYFVLLRRGPSWTGEQTDETRRIFAGHLANIRAMARAGKLVIAGPFDGDAHQKDAPAGLFVFDVATADEVKVLLAGDPALQSGRLAAEVLQWYGPAGLSYDGRDEALAGELPTP